MSLLRYYINICHTDSTCFFVDSYKVLEFYVSPSIVPLYKLPSALISLSEDNLLLYNTTLALALPKVIMWSDRPVYKPNDTGICLLF